MRYRYELTVYAEPDDEEIFTGEYYSDESLQEDLAKVDRAKIVYEAELDEEEAVRQDNDDHFTF